MFSVIFCGTPEFAVPSLRALAADDAFDIRAVVTQPDKPVGRSQALTPPPVKVTAQELGIPVLQPQRLTADALSGYSCDYLVVVAYGQILRDDALQFPAIAPINVHASLLPRWRGASPIQAALLAGDSQTGVTIQIMAKELDAGPMLAQASLPIPPDATAPSLHDKLSALGALLLAEALKQPLHPIDQPVDGITVCKKLTREDGIADQTTMNAVTIERMVRALTPWPGVRLRLTPEYEEIKVLEAVLDPGSIPATDYVPLLCKDATTLYLITVQPDGKKAMHAGAWIRGRHKR